MLDRLLLSMLILSHVLLVCIPIVFLSQGLARLNLVISGTGGVLRIFFRQPRNTRESVADFGGNVCHVNILDMANELGKI